MSNFLMQNYFYINNIKIHIISTSIT